MISDIGLNETATQMILFAYITLFLGAMGQAGFYGSMIQPKIPAWIVLSIAYPPLLIIFTLTYFKRPFLPPAPFRRSVVFAMCWIAAAVILAEILAYFGVMHRDDDKHAVALCRILMHSEWLSFIPLMNLYVMAKRAEKNQEKEKHKISMKNQSLQNQDCCFCGKHRKNNNIPSLRLEIAPLPDMDNVILWAHEECYKDLKTQSIESDKPEENGYIPAKAKCVFCGSLLPIIGKHPYCIDVGEFIPPHRFWAHADCLLQKIRPDLKDKL